MKVRAVLMITIVAALAGIGIAVSTPAAASPDTSPLKERLFSTDTKTREDAYGEMLNLGLAAENLPPAPVHFATTTNEQHSTSITVEERGITINQDWFMDLIQNKSYGSPFTAAFALGWLARSYVAQLLHIPAPFSELDVQRQQACYGGAAIRTLSQIIGTGPRSGGGYNDMGQIDNLLRAEQGDQVALVLVQARDVGQGNGFAACEVIGPIQTT